MRTPSTVRVIFTRNHRIGSILLRGFLWSGWSHCAIIDGDEVIEAVAGVGVRRQPLHALIDSASHHAIIDIPARNPAAVIAAARSQIGKPYDWLGVIGIGLRRRWQSADAWFCSELTAWAFAAGGTPIVRVGEFRVTPRDLYLPIYTAISNA
ncbi:MAG: hypothetical protein Q4G62_01610 [Pseudomonadota bacterium]|nr:hypothetical protein [Pseudomonadota bacterium]